MRRYAGWLFWLDILPLYDGYVDDDGSVFWQCSLNMLSKQAGYAAYPGWQCFLLSWLAMMAMLKGYTGYNGWLCFLCY
jgi:hypothetical protein